jgi:hypothetical protein
MHGSKSRPSAAGSLPSSSAVLSATERALSNASYAAQTPFAATNSLLAQLGTSLGDEVAKHRKHSAKVRPEGFNVIEEPGCCRIG